MGTDRATRWASRRRAGLPGDALGLPATRWAFHAKSAKGPRPRREEGEREKKETGELPVTLEFDDVEDRVDTNIKAVAWFVIEEALNNVKKYAHADQVWVRLSICDDQFVAEVEDDGDGFDYEETMATYDQRGSFGLLNFQERASLVNGRCIVRTASGRGTMVRLVVPLNHETI